MIKEREWISVMESVPDRSYKSCLVWCKHPGFNPSFEVAEWDENQQKWYSWHDTVDVTHWMPLPSPPGVDDG